MSITEYILLSLASVLFFRIFIYRAFFSPLAAIPPAHWSARFSNAWILWVRYHRRENRTIHAAHERLGPIVRLGPSEVAVNDLEGIKTVYTGGWEKPEWYSLFTNFDGVRNMFTMLDTHHHSERKRQLSNIYSKSYLQRTPAMPIIVHKIVKQSFLGLIGGAASSQQSLEISNFLSRMAMDVMSAYIFGIDRGTQMLKNPDCFSDFMKVYVERGKHSFIVQELPQILPIAKLLSLPPYTPQVAHARIMVDRFCTDLCKGTKNRIEYDSAETNDGPVFKQLKKYDELEEETDSLGEAFGASKVVASELLDHLLAGFETTAIALTYALYRLSTHKDIQAELRRELRSLEQPFFDSEQAKVPSSAEVDALPLLNAVLMETLRLNASIPGPQPRLSPKGSFLHGYGPMPAGIRVSAQAYSLHRNEDVFPEPERWDPHRWMNEDRVSDMNKYYWAFSSGGRMCVGSHLAINESKMALAAIYTNFETRVVDAAGIEQEDAYTAAPVGEVWLGFDRVSQ